MRLKLYGFIGVSMAFFFSCRQRTPPLNEVKNKDITIQFIQLKAEDGDSMLTYKARVIPDKKLMTEINRSEKNNLLYRMDSCFYISNGSYKIYASMVQPIANGVSGTFEYLLEFGVSNADKKDSINLVYHDRYINQQTYKVPVKPN
jgi:hypothetical protein